MSEGSGTTYECPECDYETLLFHVEEEEDFEPDDGNLFHSSDAPICPECETEEKNVIHELGSGAVDEVTRKRTPVLRPNETDE